MALRFRAKMPLCLPDGLVPSGFFYGMSLMRLTFVPLVLALAALTACTSNVRLDSAGRAVRAAYVDNVSSCKQLGTVTVSVTSRIGPFTRNNLSVRDELEVLARNAGSGLGADTVKPLGQPLDGQQKWGAYRCGTGPLPNSVQGHNGSSTSAPSPAATHAASTYPLPTQPLHVETVSGPSVKPARASSAKPARSTSVHPGG